MAKKTVKKKPARTTAKPKKETIDLSANGIKEFIKFAARFPVSKLSAGKPGAMITVYQNPSVRTVSDAEIPIEETATTEQINSDRVGVFHNVKDLHVGSKIKSGATVAKISAIGIDNEIKAPRGCVIKEILAQENDLIEYGQPLFSIE